MRAVKPEQAFGHVLRELREERHLSQEQLSDCGCCSRPHLSRLETGRNSPTLTMVFELAAALELEPEEFIARVKAKLRESASAS